MQIKFLGSGSAFVLQKENYQSNILITKTEEQPITISGADNTLVTSETEIITKHLLIDAGTHINDILDNYGYTATDIDGIFITHNHGDHNSGLEFLGFKTYFIPPFGTRKPKLFVPANILKTLWENVLKGNMQGLRGTKATIESYFNVRVIKPRESFTFMNTTYTPVKLPHIIDDVDEIPAYGLKFIEDDTKFFLSGDTIFDFWRLMPFWEWADVIFQDCEMLEYDGGVHAQFNQLKEIPDIYKSKMWLYHYMLNGKTFEELEQQVLNAGFAGLIFRGQIFDTKTIKGQPWLKDILLKN